jgi:PEGA domain
MTLKTALIPVGALAVVLSAGVFSAEAAQERDRDRQGNRGAQTQARRDDGRQHGAAVRPHGDGQAPRGEVRAQHDNRVLGARHNGAIYGHPRIVPPRYAFRRSPYRHYGPGPGLSVYFGTGYGYRYGAPYYGPVYGYSVAPQGYGVRRYYGDVRLEITPRDAAVYVDGYYAGVVDDFDGVFQRLTLEAGPHRIEIELPGFETRAFDVSVDPNRTVAVRDQLLPGRP